MATLYDGKGNEISVNGGGTTPVPTPTPNAVSYTHLDVYKRQI